MSITIVNIPVPSSGDGPAADVSSLLGEKTVQLAGSFRGSYVLLGSQDNLDYVPILSFDAGSLAGISQTVAGAFKSFKLRSRATGSGVTCQAAAVSSGGANYFASVASLSAGFSGDGPVVDTAALFPPSGAEADICFLCNGSFRGLLTVMGSLDGVQFNPIGSWRADGIPTGSPAGLEFSPLVTGDKTRYVQVSLDGTASGSVSVTMGGSVPTSMTTQVAGTRFGSPFGVETDVLASVPGLSVQLKASTTYKIDLVLTVAAAGAGGFKVALSSLDGATATFAMLCHELVLSSPAPTLAAAANVQAIGDASAVSATSSGGNIGTWTITGYLITANPGTLVARFAQKTTSTDTSYISEGVLTAVEQS